MDGEHHQISGNVRSKESSERKKSNNIDPPSYSRQSAATNQVL